MKSKIIEKQEFKKALIALPNTNDFEGKTVQTLMDLSLFAKDFIAGRIFIDNCLIDVAREKACITLMSKDFEKADYLFFIDSDNAFTPDVLPTLMSYDKDIISGLYFQKKAPYKPVIFNKESDGHYKIPDLDITKNELMEVDAVGMGCCLIKREVIEKMFEKNENWFKHPTFGEDISFCECAKENGFKVFVDTNIEVEHIGSFSANKSFYKAFNKK